jgi:hypothetical protein
MEPRAPERMTPENATLEMVAREASVSLATASKVLNDRPGVSQETRERVTDVLRRQGYTKRGTATDFLPMIQRAWGLGYRKWPRAFGRSGLDQRDPQTQAGRGDPGRVGRRHRCQVSIAFAEHTLCRR